jgi:hypothetical protein
MPNAAEMGYTKDIGLQEAIVVYLDSVKPLTASLNLMLDQKDPEGCIMLNLLLSIQEETDRAMKWYLEDD